MGIPVNPDSVGSFADAAGAGATYTLVVLPAGKDANVDGIATALVNASIPNTVANPETFRLGDHTVPASLPNGSYVIQAKAKNGAVDDWSPPVDIDYDTVGKPSAITFS